jgi:hypothetical protein
MKKLMTLVITLFLGASMSLAQNTGGDKSALNPQPLPPGKKATTATKTKTKKGHHKGGKKGSSSTNATTPKGTSQPSTPPK